MAILAAAHAGTAGARKTPSRFCQALGAATAGGVERGTGAGNGASAIIGAVETDANKRTRARDKATSALDTGVDRARSRSVSSANAVISSTSFPLRVEASGRGSSCPGFSTMCWKRSYKCLSWAFIWRNYSLFDVGWQRRDIEGL